MTLRRLVLCTAAACLGLGFFASSAPAAFHLMKVREVATSPAGADSSFIELQMYADGQNQVAGHVVNSYTAAGTLLGSVNIPANVANGQSQRTILIGDTATPGGPDVVNAALADYLSTVGAGGAVCFENIDCVSWGGFTGAGALPSGSGNPAPAIPVGMSLERSITPGCATLLEAGDDSNNSVADFTIAAPSPRNNATAPTERSCEKAGVGGNPTLKCRGKEATVRGTASKDNLKGTPERDVIVAGGGNDTVKGLGGNDLICGENGRDLLKGGSGKDLLVGGAAADKLLGGADKDKLLGQAGKDVCSGGGAADTGKKCEIEKKL